jgi:hypothetical protein
MQNFGVNHTSKSATNTHYNDPATLQSMVLLRNISMFGSEENHNLLKYIDDSLLYSRKPNLGLHPEPN